MIACPALPKPGYVYQTFVDSSSGTEAFDFRTTVINQRAVCVLTKTKPVCDRFSIHNTEVKFRQLDEVYSDEEIALIERFAQVMKLDWAALDVLRDYQTGRIYIVDVNTTDTGPAVDLSSGDRAKLKRAVTAAFSDMLAQCAAVVVAPVK